MGRDIVLLLLGVVATFFGQRIATLVNAFSTGFNYSPPNLSMHHFFYWDVAWKNIISDLKQTWVSWVLILIGVIVLFIILPRFYPHEIK
jgi:hypothetical protein